MSSSSNLCNNIPTPLLTCNKPRFSGPLQIRAQIPRDHEGRSSRNVVDANLHLLKVRIDEVRTRERLERCCVAEQGWNYAAYHQTFKPKPDLHRQILAEFAELAAVVAPTFGATILGCTSFLCVVSLLIHIHQ